MQPEPNRANQEGRAPIVSGFSLTRRRRACGLLVASVLFCAATPASAFDPANGDWAKDDPDNLRVMTYNVYQGIGVGMSTTPATANTIGSQHAYLGLICAALDPDVLCLQEIKCETPATQAQAQTALQTWANSYLGTGRHVYVSSATDGHNRNAVVSRYPFADLNGDGQALRHDIFLFPGPDDLPPGTPPGGHLRGWLQAEIDLPDDVYRGDILVVSGHLKCCGGAANMAERLTAAQNMAYWINASFNDTTDIFSPPQPLADATPVVLCGDLNEDEDANGRYGPVAWLAGWTPTPDDGTDRDDTSMQVAAAAEPFNGSLKTYLGSSRLDYVLTQDAIAPVASAFLFDSQRAAQHGALPATLATVLNGANASTLASDHLPVIVDLGLPKKTQGDFNGDGFVTVDDYAALQACLSGPAAPAGNDCLDVDLSDDGAVDLYDFARWTLLISDQHARGR